MILTCICLLITYLFCCADYGRSVFITGIVTQLCYYNGTRSFTSLVEVRVVNVYFFQCDLDKDWYFCLLITSLFVVQTKVGLFMSTENLRMLL